MSKAPPIQYSGPTIDPSVPWEISQHLQLLYQKLGNHTQAFQQVAQQLAGVKTGSTTTNIVEGQGGSSPAPPSGSFLGQGLINNQSGETGYATQPGDNGILLVVNDASPVAVSLTTDAAPFYLIITNTGSGTATLTPSSGTINGGASLSLLQGQTVYAACDSTNWITTAIQVAPQNTPAVAHEFLTAYNASTGAFTQAQPAFTDISGAATSAQVPALSALSGQITTSQLPSAGITVTITTAQLTPTGAQGSMTFQNGLLTAQTPAS
jgi:hypothetical protein